MLTGQYFPDKEQWAKEQGFDFEPVPGMEKRTALADDVSSYSIKSSTAELEINGAAVSGPDTFRLQEVHLKKSAHAQAEAILNLFITWHRTDG